MAKNSAFVASLHTTMTLKKGDLFIREGQRNQKIGQVLSGVMRAYVIDGEGNEITTHFYQENDMVLASFIPDVGSQVNIQALENCKLTTGSFSEIMSYVNKNEEITQIINRAFHKLNGQLQSRLVALANLNSLEKYKLFLKEYPNLINRIPHYMIANFLGITPTQLSRARKQLVAS